MVCVSRSCSLHPSPHSSAEMLNVTQVVGFKNEHSYEDRESESARIIAKYADRIPVIVERDSKASASLELLDKKKYLVPKELDRKSTRLNSSHTSVYNLSRMPSSA